MKKEIWDLFDKDENFQRKFVRGHGSIPDGLYHKTVEVIPTDMEGRLLLTRRSLRKTTGAGKLEFPAGSVMSGESETDAALREMEEETGLRPVKLFFLQRVRTRGVLRYTYLAYVPDMSSQKISYDPEEIMDHMFVTYDQWLQLLTSWEYNSFRARFYCDKLFEKVKKLVNENASAALMNATKKRKPLRETNTLATKAQHIIDDECCNKEPPIPESLKNWQPDPEEGDDVS